MLVEILTVERGNYRPRIHALGEVQPARDIRLSPRVRGEIIARADAFTPGGFLEEGATILRVDPADYENTVKQRPSEWEQAKADLHIEMGRQKVAQLDFELLGEDASALADRDLVLGQPQLHAAQAKVAFAEAQLALAELDWQRCEIDRLVRAGQPPKVLTAGAVIGAERAEALFQEAYDEHAHRLADYYRDL